MSDYALVNSLHNREGERLRFWSATPNPNVQPFVEGVVTQVDNERWVELDGQVWVNLAHVELIGPPGEAS
jgi:hypothetical protein